MRRIYTGGGAILLLCTALLGGCAAGNETVEEPAAPHVVQSSQSEEVDITPPDTEEITYEYITEELYAKRDDNQIYGVIYIPQEAGQQMPAVIFSHGFGGNYQVGAQYAEALAAKGYVVYCFDFCGGSPGSRSDGSTLDFSLWMTVGRTYAENLLDYDIYEVIQNYDKEVLLIHGDADSIVPLSYSERAVEVYKSARLEVLPGAEHGFYGSNAEQAINWMLEYLKTHKQNERKGR